VRVFNSFSLQSFTFASIMDDRLDNGTLTWMDVPSGSPQRPYNSIPRKTFLQCEPGGGGWGTVWATRSWGVWAWVSKGVGVSNRGGHWKDRGMGD
jgi:hypothetical protein